VTAGMLADSRERSAAVRKPVGRSGSAPKTPVGVLFLPLGEVVACAVAVDIVPCSSRHPAEKCQRVPVSSSDAEGVNISL